jgi:DNA-binding NtrC family response regulator
VDEAMPFTVEEDLDLVVTDIRMEPRSGLALLKHMRETRSDVPVIMMTAFATVETALDALKTGAFDYIAKPFRLEAFLEVVERALSSGVRGSEPLAPSGDMVRFGRVVCGSEAMHEACRLVELVAPTPAAVLLIGERGTGRSLLADVIHGLSRRKDAPLETVDCSRLPGVSALIGTPRPEQADDPAPSGLLGAAGGTVLVENVGDLDTAGQEILLEVLRNKAVSVPGEAPRPIDVRIVATATPDLSRRVSSGAFSEDLFRRLALVRISLPPLRECRDAILPTANVFMHEVLGDAAVLPVLTADVRGALVHYNWPGNVGELHETIAYACGRIDGGRITRESLPAHILETLTGSVEEPQPTRREPNRAQALRAFLKQQGVDPHDVAVAASAGA